MTAETGRKRTVQAVEHAMDVLDCLYRSHGPLGVSDIARKTELSKAAIHHLLGTLESRRYVMRDPDTRKYRLSWTLFELGSSVVRDVDLSRAARPFLDRLAEQIDESVLLGILDSDAVLYVDRAEAPSGLRMVANTGRRGPLTATASGKVYLAFHPSFRDGNRLFSEPLPRFTPTTITNPEVLKKQLLEVRRNGYATCWEEREVGLCSLAAPIRDYTGSVAGSLAIVGPAGRLNHETAIAHVPLLLRAVHQIELHVGASDD